MAHKLRPGRPLKRKTVLRNKEIRTDLNLWAINLKFLKFIGHIVVTIFHFMSPPGLNLIAINFKFLKIVDNYVTYNL